MKEVRLTFGADNFGAVSQALIDMGIGFRVELIDVPAKQAAPTRVSQPAPATKWRRSTKKGRTEAGAGAGKKNADRHPSRPDVAASGAERLREAVSRSRNDAGDSAAAPSERAAEEAG